MSIAPFPADHDADGIGVNGKRANVSDRKLFVKQAEKHSGIGLVDMERELTRLLLEYDELRTAWPKGGHVLVRARIGRQVANALARIDDLEHAIASTPARTPAEAAVRRRRLAALERAGIIPWGAF